MNDQHDELQPIDPFEAFRHGRLDGFRHFYGEYSYRIYRYLFHQTGEEDRSKELIKYCFIVLFRNHNLVNDQAHLLRILYLLARMSVALALKGPDGILALENEWRTGGQDDAAIMDDPAVKRNEMRIAIQWVLQQVPLPSAN